VQYELREFACGVRVNTVGPFDSLPLATTEARRRVWGDRTLDGVAVFIVGKYDERICTVKRDRRSEWHDYTVMYVPEPD
jgi:hypothetical protein